MKNNFEVAVRTLNTEQYNLLSTGQLISKKIFGLGNEIFVVLKERQKRFQPDQVVKHNGEEYTIEKISKNGWVKFVGIKSRTRVQYIEPIVRETEMYYTIPNNDELIVFIKEKLKNVSIFNLRKTINLVIIAVNMLK